MVNFDQLCSIVGHQIHTSIKGLHHDVKDSTAWRLIVKVPLTDNKSGVVWSMVEGEGIGVLLRASN